MGRSNDDLVEDVRRRAADYLGCRPRDARVLGAMRRVDRALFLPASSRAEAYEDCPLAIGGEQTCSEPSMAAFMLEVLEAAPGARILEIGAGSGYAAAIASLLCAPGGLVYACELEETLARTMEENLERWRRERRDAGDGGAFAPVRPIAGDGSAGFPDLAPFDRVLVSAGARRLGEGGFREAPLLDQLAADGILVYPECRGSLRRIRKLGAETRRDCWPGVAFVPLRGVNA